MIYLKSPESISDTSGWRSGKNSCWLGSIRVWSRRLWPCVSFFYRFKISTCSSEWKFRDDISSRPKFINGNRFIILRSRLDDLFDLSGFCANWPYLSCEWYMYTMFISDNPDAWIIVWGSWCYWSGFFVCIFGIIPNSCSWRISFNWWASKIGHSLLMVIDNRSWAVFSDFQGLSFGCSYGGTRLPLQVADVIDIISSWTSGLDGC